MLGVLLVLVLPASACRSASAPAPELEQLPWSEIALPSGLRASSLTAWPAGGVLLGGRSAAGGSHPVLLRIGMDGAPHPLVLRPHSSYAPLDDLTSVATDGRRVVALGGARGGAHANVRWTVWSGDAHRLDDQPQTFETFGGQSAGGLLDVVLPVGGPVVVGSWSGVHGLDGAVWHQQGRTWMRRSSEGTALANTAIQQVGPRSATAAGPAVLVSGSVITFPDGIKQQAAVWRQRGPSRSWELLPLPDPGRSSEARSMVCADQCWVSGRVGDDVALWRLDPVPTREPALPVVAVDRDGPGPRTLLPAGAGPGVLSSAAGRSALALSLQDRWHRYAAPAGTVMAATTSGSRIYAVLGDGERTRLWTTDVDGIGQR